MQSHSCQEIVSRGIQTQLVEAYLGNKMTDLLKSSYIKNILTTIDNVADPERTKAAGYEAELEERVSAILAEEQLIYATAHGGGDTSDSDRQGLWNVRDIPDYTEAGSFARSRATRAGAASKTKSPGRRCGKHSIQWLVQSSMNHPPSRNIWNRKAASRPC